MRQRVQSRAFSHARGHLRVSRVLFDYWFLLGSLPMKMIGVHLLLGTLRAVVATL